MASFVMFTNATIDIIVLIVDDITTEIKLMTVYSWLLAAKSDTEDLWCVSFTGLCGESCVHVVETVGNSFSL